jgi:hypothetical protein
MKGKEGFDMASKKANHKNHGQEVMFPPGTRHSYPASLSTLTRLPLEDMQVGAMPVKAASGHRREFILALLTQAGPQGITWGEIRADLVKAFGSAPKKRAALYSLLAGVAYHKTREAKGVVRYFLGREPKRGKGKSK